MPLPLKKDMHDMGNQFPYSPIKTGDPSFRTFKGPIHDPPSPVQNNFDDGFRDGNYEIQTKFQNFA